MNIYLKRNLLVLCSIIALGLTACNPSSNSSSSDSTDTSGTSEIQGDGSKDNPYLINDKEDLIALQTKVNDESFDGYVADLADAPYYKLTNDIDLGGIEWEPICKSIKEDFSNLFTAYFDGDGHTISNFKITKFDLKCDSYGLFGNFHGFIYDLNVTDFEINLLPVISNTNIFVGGLVGYADLSAFENISVDGNISVIYNGDKSVVIGGTVGYSGTYVTYTEDGQPKANVTFARFITNNADLMTNATNSFVGGVFGYIATSGGNGATNLSYIVNHGSIISPSYAGGITSYLDRYCTISFAYNDADVTSGVVAGGIAGYAAGDTAVTNSFVASKTISVAKEQINGEVTVGSILGYYSPENVPEYAVLSSLMHNCYVSNVTAIKLADVSYKDSNNTPKTSTGNLADEEFLSKNLGFTKTEWTFSKNSYPILVTSLDNIDFGASVKVDFVSNMDGVVKEGTNVSKYDFDVFDTLVSKDGYTFQGWFYDKECTIDYRFYLPLFNDTTLYGAWKSYDEFAGLYVPKQNYGGMMQFNDDGTMTFFYSDYTYTDGEYTYYGDYIYFETESNEYDGGWGLTYGLWQDGNLYFYANDASSTEFNYEIANDLVGYYRNGKYAIDFLSNTRGKLTLPTNDEIIEISFDYEIEEGGIIKPTSKDGKLTSIEKLGDGSIKVVYDGATYENFKSIPLKTTYNGAFVGKTYRGYEYNEEEGMKDLTFREDGVVLQRHSYSGYLSGEIYDLDMEVTNYEDGIFSYKYSYEYDEGNTIDTYVRTISKNKNDEYYTYTEYEEEVEYGEVTYQNEKIICTTLTRQDLKNGNILFEGNHQYYTKTSTYYLEFTVEQNSNKISSVSNVSYQSGGGYYIDGNNVYLKSTNSMSAVDAVLTYNAEKDYFISHSATTNKYYMLAASNVLGVFSVSNLAGQIYAYKDFTYYLDENGIVSDVTINSGSFDNDDEITLTISGNSYTYDVVNLYATNTLTLR